MKIDHENLEVRTYPQEASHRCRKWDWKVWDGSKLLVSGFVEGTDADARSAGNAAMQKLIEGGTHG